MNQRDALVLLDRYIRARYPVIAVQSHEESRVLTGIRAIAENRKMTLITWSLTEGLRDAEIDYEAVRNALEAHRRPERVPDFDPDMTREPAAAFEAIKASLNRKKFLFVFKDLHGNLGSRDRGFDPLYTRFLRDIAALYEKTPGNLILLSPALQIPPELDKIIALIDWPLPDASDLAAILNKAENDLPDDFPVTLNGNRERVVQAMRGLTAFEASQVLSAGIIATRKLGDDIIPHIIREKSQIIKKSGVLEYFDTDVTMKHIGGLQHLKAYAARTRSAFSDSAREEGVDTPKGVLLVGIPGTGKSLAAKAIAGGELPLLRMDIGALMGGLVGQSESNMRSALKVAEAVAPAILWVDEIEKALGGSGGGELDGGTSARVFGTFLTWMQETTAPVYVVATANNFKALRPELISRFNDTFWVDLPNHASRVEILTIHLERRKRDPQAFDLDTVADALWGFSGREIEKVIKEAIGTAFFERRPVTTEDLLNAAAHIVPLLSSMKDSIDTMRRQIDNARQAGDPLEPRPFGDPQPAGVGRLDLSDL